MICQKKMLIRAAEVFDVQVDDLYGEKNSIGQIHNRIKYIGGGYMSKYICKDGTEATITHTMADGSIRESVDGYKIPVNEKN